MNYAQDFSSQIKAFAKKVQDKTDATLRVAALDLTSRIINRTPVLTGRAKANWQVTVNEVPTSSLVETDKDGSATMAKAAAILGKAQYIQTVYVANNVNYIVGLEYGKSQKSPAGMVRVTVAEWSEIVAHAAEVTKRNPGGSLTATASVDGI